MKQRVLMFCLVLGMCVAVMAFASANPALSPTPAMAVDFVHVDGPIEASSKCSCPQGCSLKKFMKKEMDRAVSSGDSKKLAKAFQLVSAKSPPGYSDWKKMADQGRKYAQAGDLKSAKKVCKDCHMKYQKKYRKSPERCKPW